MSEKTSYQSQIERYQFNVQTRVVRADISEQLLWKKKTVTKLYDLVKKIEIIPDFKI